MQQGNERPHVPPMPVQLEDDDELAPIGLVDEEGEQKEASNGVSTQSAKKIQAFGVAGMHSEKTDWRRQPTVSQTGAIRVRSFHGRLSDQGLGFMDDQINEWLDKHPEIEVKNVTTTVGQFEGKIREPALIVNIWY